MLTCSFGVQPRAQTGQKSNMMKKVNYEKHIAYTFYYIFGTLICTLTLFEVKCHFGPYLMGNIEATEKRRKK
jgi:hypothetical protein